MTSPPCTNRNGNMNQASNRKQGTYTLFFMFPAFGNMNTQFASDREEFRI
jgi:hypothetical protein